jgi:hypothetical protein
MESFKMNETIAVIDIESIRHFILSESYSIKSHAARHIIEEGFTEENVVEAILNGRIIEEYPDEKRCLICGTAHIAPKTKISLHLICDYSDPEWLDIVTAYIPQLPQWETPTRRSRRRRK